MRWQEWLLVLEDDPLSLVLPSEDSKESDEEQEEEQEQQNQEDGDEENEESLAASQFLSLCFKPSSSQR